jgi:hypothetical protein
MTTNWSFAQACVWIATGDASLANDVHQRCTIFEAAFTIFEVDLTSGQSKVPSAGTSDVDLDIDAETLEAVARRLEGIARRKAEDLKRRCLALVWDAREKLLDALRNKQNKSIASGRANGVGNTGPIETELWLGLTLHDEPGSRPGHGVVARPEDGLNFSATWFDEISLAVDDVLRVWPADGSAAASFPPTPAIAQQSPAEGAQPETFEQNTEQEHSPRRAGAKRFQRAAVLDYLNEQYPDGVPAEVSARSIQTALEAQRKSVSLRTIRRAMGGK